MTLALLPYLQFKDQARAALEYYHSIFGGQLEFMTFGDFAKSAPDNPDMHGGGDPNLVMHGSLFVERTIHLYAADSGDNFPAPNADGRSPVALCISDDGEDPAHLEQARGWWKQLAPDSEVMMDLGPAPWGGEFGQLTDKFGNIWMFGLNPKS